MSRLPVVSGKRAVKALEKLGYYSIKALKKKRGRL